MPLTFISLLSGGLDSTVATYAAQKELGSGEALFCDYGQKAVKRELQAARRLTKLLRMPLEVIRLPFLEAVTKTALVMNEKVIPQVKGTQLDDRSETEKSAQQVWVPNRNGLMLNIAAALAEGKGLTHIVVGFNSEEAVTFPDNSANFLNKAEEFFSYSTQKGLKVLAPTIACNKHEIVQLGRQLQVPFEEVWSCYHGGRKQCGSCESCQRSIRAYAQAGILHDLQSRFNLEEKGGW